MARLVDSLEFVGNPFETYVAENEPDINRYFVRPPYYNTLQGRALRQSSFVLFGARGAGKSAARLAVYKDLWRRITNKEQGPLILTVDNFSFVLRDGLEQADLRGYICEIGFTLVEGILVWLATLSEDDREVFTKTLNKQEEKLLIALTMRFYLCRPETARTMSSRRTMQLLDQAWADRTKIWIQQKRNQIAGVVASIAGSLARRHADLGDDSFGESLERLFTASNTDFNDAHYVKAILERFVECARAFGFSGVAILVDKVDETQATSNSVEASARLLYPVLSTIQLLEIEGLGWTFFLWDRLKEPYGSGLYPVRLDKIANASISWRNEFLAELVDSRIKHFSKDRCAGFVDLCVDGAPARTWLDEIIGSSMQSPRELIRALDTILREHDNRYAEASVIPRLDRDSIEMGLDAYAVEQAENSFRAPVLRQLFRMNQTRFINREVQSLFRINDASARNRIRSWVDAGLVARTGDRPAEGGVGGKPAHEFSISDPRVRRIVERGLASRMQIPVIHDEEFDDSASEKER